MQSSYTNTDNEGSMGTGKVWGGFESQVAISEFGAGSVYIRDEAAEGARSEWLAALPAALLMVSPTARTSAERAARTLAGVATFDEATGTLTVTGWTLESLAGKAQCATDQIKRGIRSLKRHNIGVVADVGTNRNPSYELRVIAEIQERAEYGRPDDAAVASVMLNEDQQALVDGYGDYLDADWTETGDYVTHGYAGTGKTQASIQGLRERYGIEHDAKVVYLAPTNKAAAVMREHGVRAVTIHSALYWRTNERTEANGPVFAKKTSGHELDELMAADVVLVDEASMVSGPKAEWINQNAKRVIAVGDPMQLPPIGTGPDGQSTWAGPDSEATYELTRVERYDDKSKIGSLAARLREPTWRPQDLEPFLHHTVCDPNDYDAVIVWTNVERWAVIDLAREALGRPKGCPVVGDEIIFTGNYTHPRRLPEWEPYRGPDDCYNGQASTVEEVLGRVKIDKKLLLTYPTYTTTKSPYYAWTLRVRDHDTGKRRVVLVHEHGFTGGVDHERSLPPRPLIHEGRPVLAATFGHVLTAHKAQGSGYERVLVINAHRQLAEAYGDEFARRWTYTSITRAKQHVDICNLSQVKGFESIKA